MIWNVLAKCYQIKWNISVYRYLFRNLISVPWHSRDCICSLKKLRWVRVQTTWCSPIRSCASQRDKQLTRTVVTCGHEIQNFFPRDCRESIPPVGISPILHINPWSANTTQTCFPLVVLLWEATVGAHSVPCPFVIVTDRIPYTNFESDYYTNLILPPQHSSTLVFEVRLTLRRSCCVLFYLALEYQ